MRFKSTILKEFVDQSVVCISWTGYDEIIIGRYVDIQIVFDHIFNFVTWNDLHFKWTFNKRCKYLFFGRKYHWTL